MSKGPIYIGGVSYSGKTQLRLLLSNHPEIVITRRTYLWRKIYNQFGDLSQESNFENCLSNILELKPIQLLNPNPDRIRKEFWQGETSYSRLFSLLHQHYADGLGKTRWGIQIGKAEADAAIILSAEPNARIIQVIRNPVDRIEESLSKASFRLGLVGLELNRWTTTTSFGIANLEKFPKNYLFVKWEDILGDVETTLARVCDFIGETYYPGMVQLDDLERMGLRQKNDPSTEKIRLAGKEPVDHQPLSKGEHKFIEAETKSERRVFNYLTTKIHLSFFELINYLFLVFPINKVGVVLGKFKKS